MRKSHLVPSFFFIVISFLLIEYGGIGGCGGSSVRGSSGTSDTVTISGTVSLPDEPSSLSIALKTGETKRGMAIGSGTVTAYDVLGSVLGSSTVTAGGSYSMALNASGLAGNPVFMSFLGGANGVMGGITSTLHSLDFIPSDATSATINIDPKTDFSTGVFLGAVAGATGSSFEIGGNLSGAVAAVIPDAVKKLTEAVTGDDDISASTSIDKLDTALEGAYEAHRGIVGSAFTSSSSTKPANLLAGAIQGSAGAVAQFTGIKSTVGGGIPVDSNLFGGTKKFMDTLLGGYANPNNAAQSQIWSQVRGLMGTLAPSDYKIFSDPIGQTGPSDTILDSPDKLRNCSTQMMGFGISAPFVSSHKPSEALKVAAKAGGCDDETEGKFTMGVIGGALPVASAGGTYDFSNFVGGIVGQTGAILGQDLKNRVTNPDDYSPDDIKAALSDKLTDPETVQTCALTGLAGCGELTTALVTGGDSADVSGITIKDPPGTVCTSNSSCAPGSVCVPQASGTSMCAAISWELGLTCDEKSECDNTTYCAAMGVCILLAGAPEGAVGIGAGGITGVLGSAASGVTELPDDGEEGGGCLTGNTCTGGATCSGEVCVTDILVGTGFTCSANSDCGSGSCSGGLCQPPSTSTGSVGAGNATCTSNTQCASNSCVNGACETGSFFDADGGIVASSGSGGSGGGSGGTGGSGGSGAPACSSNCPEGTACTSDSICGTGYHCGDRTSATATGACRADDTGAVGQYCTQPYHCALGLQCSPSHICESI